MITAKLADGRMLKFPDGTDPSVIQATVKKVIGASQEAVAPAPPEGQATDQNYNPYTAENIAGSAVEPIITLATGVAGGIAGGLAGLGTLATGGDSQKATENIQNVAEAMTYKPRTAGGKIATEAIQYPFKLYAEATKDIGGQQLKDDLTEGSPEYKAAWATATKTALDIIPMLAGAKAIKGKPSFPKAEAAIKNAVKYPFRLAEKVGRTAKEAVSHRLPGGNERAIGAVLTELIGEKRLPIVIKALEKAKPGETVGQAASRTGSKELAALQKMLEKRDPSGYGDILTKQHYARLKEMKDAGGTPKQLAKAKAQMEKHAAEGYGKVKGDLIDPRSPKERLIDASAKAETKAASAEQSKIHALQDKSRLQTTEAQMENLAQGNIPRTGVIRDQSIREPARYSPESEAYNSPRYKGEVRAPARYSPQRQRSLEAKETIKDVEKIIEKRLNTQKAHTAVSETMLMNTLGESGAGFGKFNSRPSIQAAIESARQAAAETGSYFPKNPSDKFSIANLQRIKRAVAENITNQRAQGSLAATTEAEITTTLKAFTKFLRGKSKGFARAEDMFAAEIKNVNRMKVIQAIAKVLKPRLGSQERALQFATAIDDASRLVRSETGRKMPLSELLKSKQLNMLKRIKRELDRDVTVKQDAVKGNQRMNEAVGTMHDIPKVTLLERAIVVFNAIMKRIEGRNHTVTLDMMAQKFKNPAETVKILKAATPKEANFIKNMDPEVAAMIIGSETEEQ